MGPRPERRHLARRAIPSPLSGPGREPQEVRLLDLSPVGARIEQIHLLPEWSTYFLDLPLALEGARLQGKVIWSEAGERRPGPEGKGRISYETGRSFRSRPPAQRAGLTAAREHPQSRPGGRTPRGLIAAGERRGACRKPRCWGRSSGSRRLRED